jgi:hypothetical protein
MADFTAPITHAYFKQKHILIHVILFSLWPISGGKVKVISVFNYVIKHHTMKAYGGVELQLHHSWSRHWEDDMGSIYIKIFR